MAPIYTIFQMCIDVMINKVKLPLKDLLTYNSFVMYFVNQELLKLHYFYMKIHYNILPNNVST